MTPFYTRLARLLGQVDRGVAKALHHVLWVLCWTTGKDNYFFARLSLGLSTVVWLIWVVHLYLVITGQWWLLRVLWLLPIGILTWAMASSTRSHWYVISLVEKVNKRLEESGLVLYPPDEVITLRTTDLLLGFLTIFDWHLSWLPLRAISMYFLWDYHPPRSGRLKRALGKLREQLAVRPGAAPMPSPA